MEGILVLLALAGAIYAGYYFRTKKEASMMKSVLIGFLAWTVLALVAGGIGYAMMSDEEKAQMEAEQARKDSIEAAKEAQIRPRLTTDDFDDDRVLKDITDALATLDNLADNPNNNSAYRTLRDILWIITDNMA